MKDLKHIINSSLKKILDDEEIKWVTILGVLHKNINKLIDNAEKWFHENIPDEYSEVVNSLVSLSSNFIETKKTFSNLTQDEKKVEISALELIKTVADNFYSLTGSGCTQITCEEQNTRIITSPVTLKQSLLSLFLTFGLFRDSGSTCKITLRRERSNINIEIYFRELGPVYPGIFDVQKVFFHYKDDGEYRLGLGIHTALYNIRNIGAIVKVLAGQLENDCIIAISFPSVDFLNTIEQIRKREANQIIKQDIRGEVIVVVHDIVVEMVLREALLEEGFSQKLFSILDFEQCNECSEYKALIIDYDYIVHNFINTQIFDAYLAMKTVRFKKILMIYDPEKKNEIDKVTHGGIILVEKPITVDNIIKEISGD